MENAFKILIKKQVNTYNICTKIEKKKKKKKKKIQWSKNDGY